MNRRPVSILLLLFPLLLLSFLIALPGCGGSEKGEEAAPQAGPIEGSQAAGCAANRRAIESALQAYQAANGKPPSSLQQLVPQYLQKLPSCPAGGSYQLSGTTVSCSVHGR